MRTDSQLSPDLLRLLCRWCWYNGQVIITGRPFRDEDAVVGIAPRKPDDVATAEKLERYAEWQLRRPPA